MLCSIYLQAPQSFGLVSKNPVLKNITDYLVDEGSYEEEAYFGKCSFELFIPFPVLVGNVPSVC